jgi:hypothetical protein
MLVLIFPAFLASATLAAPALSHFEQALPMTRAQLLWARVIATLDLVWLPLLIGWCLMQPAAQPFSEIREPFECAAFFTLCICLATLARLATNLVAECLWALLALACALLAERYLTSPAALAITAAALTPVGAKLWWTYVPERSDTRSGPVVARPIWPMLRLLCSPRTLLYIPFAFWIGLDRSYSLLVFAFLWAPSFAPNRFLLGLPVSRRLILAATMAPAVAALLAGAALSSAPDQNVGERNPPGLSVPIYFLSPDVPVIVAPWGETAEAPVQWRGPWFMGSGRLYNPYWVGPENSERFAQWQFQRATSAIYGRPLTFEELRAALAAGLKPVTSQARFTVIRVSFGIAWLLAIAAASAIGDRAKGQWKGRLILWLVWVALLGGSFWLAAPTTDSPSYAFLRLSALLPSNLALMSLLLLIPLAGLYWVLETAFQSTEFPGKPKETE